MLNAEKTSAADRIQIRSFYSGLGFYSSLYRALIINFTFLIDQIIRRYPHRDRWFKILKFFYIELLLIITGTGTNYHQCCGAGRSRCEGPAPTPPLIKQMKF